MTVFGDVSVIVYENSDILNFTFSFKCVLLESQKFNYFKRLLYIATFDFSLHPCKFYKKKINPLSLSWNFLQKL